MLIINSVLSSSIIFPSYFILKKYISQQTALLGSLLIAVLPAITLFNFILMSENLFIPLTIFSIWFLHEAFEKNNVRWDFLAALSVFYLYFTRETGLVFLIAVWMTLTFFVFSGEKGTRLKVVKDKAVLICALAIPLLFWFIYKISLSRISFYGTDHYIQSLIHSFSNIKSFESFSILMLHEIEYLVLSAYVMISIISIIFIVGCLFRLRFFGFNDYLQKCCPEKVLALRSVIIYCLTFCAGLLVISVIHMQTLGITSLFGRYVDPIVPAIFIFGIIGIEFLFRKYTDSNWKYEIVLCLGISIILFLVYTLPNTSYVFPNALGAYYLFYLHDFLNYSFPIIFLLLAVVFVFIPYYFLKNSHKKHFLIILFIYLIALSVVLYIPIYDQQNKNMSDMKNVNQIGTYLKEHSSTGTQILMDSDSQEEYSDLKDRWWYSRLTQFWIPGKVIHGSTAEDSSGVFTKEFIDKADYIISQKLLPYPCVNVSNNGFKLYTPHIEDQFVQHLTVLSEIDIGSDAASCIIDGFYGSEGTFRWTSEFSEVKIEYPQENGSFILRVKTGGERPENNPANVTFFINGHFIGSMVKTTGTEIYSVVIPKYYLKNNYQILEIRTNTWKPSDYGSSDTRNLGILVEWIRLDDLSFDEMYELEYWDSVPTRWMSDNATLLIYADENRIADLTFRAVSFYRHRTLEIFHGPTLQTAQQVLPTGSTNVSARFALQKGENIIRLNIPEGCDRPGDVSELNNNDTRCLSIAVQNITFS
jgi:hypothetical protein